MELALGVVSAIAFLCVVVLTVVTLRSLGMIDQYRQEWSGPAAFKRRAGLLGKPGYTEAAAADRAAATQPARIEATGSSTGTDARLEQPEAELPQLTPSQQADYELARLSENTGLPIE